MGLIPREILVRYSKCHISGKNHQTFLLVRSLILWRLPLSSDRQLHNMKILKVFGFDFSNRDHQENSSKRRNLKSQISQELRVIKSFATHYHSIYIYLCPIRWNPQISEIINFCSLFCMTFSIGENLAKISDHYISRNNPQTTMLGGLLISFHVSLSGDRWFRKKTFQNLEDNLFWSKHRKELEKKNSR